MSTPKQRRAILYTRVSTAAQSDDGTSLAAQFVACSAKAKELNAIVVSHLEETESGGLYLSRPKIQAALEAIERGEADTLIIYKLDRTSRDVDALRDIRRRVTQAGGLLVFADGMQFEKTPVGNLMFTQLGAFAEFEREIIRERTSSGSRRRAEGGIMPCRARRPYGYRFIRYTDVASGTHNKDEIGQYLIVESEAHWVRAIFESYASGSSLMEVCRMLHDNAVPTMRGGLCWRGCTVHNILKNPIYKGKPAYGKRAFAVNEARMQKGVSVRYSKPRTPDEWISFDAPALVSVELFEQCQKRLKTAQGFHSGPKTGRRLLSGLVRCKQCGRVLQFNAAKIGVRPQPNRTVGYYRCFHPLDPVRCESKLRHHNANRLHKAVAQTVIALMEDESLIQSAMNEYAREQAKRKASTPATNWKRLEAERKKLNARLTATIEAEITALSSGRDTTPYRNRLEELDAQIKAIDAQLSEREAKPNKTSEKQEARTWQGMAQSVAQVLESDTIAEHDKNKALTGFIHHVTSDENGIEIYFREHANGLFYNGLFYYAHFKDDALTVKTKPVSELETSLPPKRSAGSLTG